jgi:hypothetical protein
MTFPHANRFPLTATLARNCNPDELAKWLDMPEAWAAGVVDAIDGNPGNWTDDAPTQQERKDYAAGFRLGQTLLNDFAAPELTAA